MKRALGKQETQFLAYTQMRELRAVRTGDLMRPLGLTREQERELFRRLARWWTRSTTGRASTACRAATAGFGAS